MSVTLVVVNHAPSVTGVQFTPLFLVIRVFSNASVLNHDTNNQACSGNCSSSTVVVVGMNAKSNLQPQKTITVEVILAVGAATCASVTAGLVRSGRHDTLHITRQPRSIGSHCFRVSKVQATL
jgi:hypothetical protein